MNHAPFIIAAYAVVTIVLVALVAWVLVDGRQVARRLQALEARGIRRRSAPTG